MNEIIKIAIPKGRMLEESVKLLNEAGFEFSDIFETKALSVKSSCSRLEVLIVRSADVPAYVAHGASDLGIAGKDVLMENEDVSGNIFELLNFKFGRCRIVIAAKKDEVPEYPVLRVATKYPAIAKKIFDSKGKPVEIIKLYGSVELAPLTDLADVIVDIVETGATLSANGLAIIEEVGISTARLIANRVSYKIKFDEISEIIKRLEKVR